MGGSLTSPVIDVSKLNGWAVQFVWTGSPTGTIKVQASINGTDFDDVTDATTDTGGVAGKFTFNTAYPVSYPYIRMLYTRVSGTGSLNAWASGKEVIF